MNQRSTTQVTRAVVERHLELLAAGAPGVPARRVPGRQAQAGLSQRMSTRSQTPTLRSTSQRCCVASM